jgi:hypothetical protein
VRAIAARLAGVTAGLTPEKLALVITIGFVLGTFPVLGTASILCAIAAIAFRLNMPAIQAVGQIVTPVQYALLLPLARLGARLLGARPGFGGAVVHAVTGWFCFCVPFGVVLYITLVFAMRGARSNIAAIGTAA